jgi:hypothetical protein
MGQVALLRQHGDGVMSIVRLGDIQRAYRAKQKARHRVELRKYLLDGAEPSAVAYQTVSRRLYVEGQIDNLGLAFHWIATATMAERAALFSAIATSILSGATSG